MSAHGDPARPDPTRQSVVPPTSVAVPCVPLQNALGTLLFISGRHRASRARWSPGLQEPRRLLCAGSGQAGAVKPGPRAEPSVAYPTGPPSGRAPARPVPKPLAGQMLVLQMGCKEKKGQGAGAEEET